jgi:hypothetical protein
MMSNLPAYQTGDLAMDETTSRLPTKQGKADKQERDVEGPVTGYCERALRQAKAQFWFSVVAATVGFAWIVYSCLENQTDKLSTISKIMPGTVFVAVIMPGAVIGAVAYMLFRQASETRERATELCDRLRDDRLITESASLISSIEDVRLRDMAKAHLALHMSGLNPAEIDLEFLFSKELGKVPNEVETENRSNEGYEN